MVRINSLNEEQQEFLILLKEFIACANYSCSLFREIYSGGEPYLYAYRTLKKIPKNGYLNEVYFNFHGGGCYFEYQDTGLSIDVEFYENNSCEGLGPFRLYSFMNSKKEKFVFFKSESDIERMFKQFITLGIVRKKGSHFERNLYYLVDSVQNVT